MAYLDKAFYLASLRRESAAFADAARVNMELTDVTVPGCPDWNITDLVLHLGGVHRHVTYRVRNRIYPWRGFTPQELYDLMAMDPEWGSWYNSESPRNAPIPTEVIDWFEQGAARLAEALDEADPAEPVGTWFQPNQTAGFWQRRMAQETAVHRWDAQSVGQDSPLPVEPELSADGIDEMLDVMLPAYDARGEGESIHFHATDGAGEWLLHLEPDGVKVRREHAKGDAAVRGTASNILLYVRGRPVEAEIEVIGDQAALGKIFAAFDGS